MDPNRWAIKKIREDILVAAIMVSTWAPREETEALDLAKKVGEMLRDASEAAMPRTKRLNRRADGGNC
jgi:hypothetical protein